MTLTLWIVLLLVLISESISQTVRCKPPNGMPAKSGLRRRQKTFIRNPNYKSANERFDKLAEGMYITELPLPHPGAQAGSSKGCEVDESEVLN